MEFDLSLDAVARRPELVRELAPQRARDLRLQARVALAALDDRVESGEAPSAAVSSAAAPHDNDPTRVRNVDAKTAARILGVSQSWIWHRVRELPFVVHIGGRTLFELEGIQKYNEKRLRDTIRRAPNGKEDN
jgi:predicted DNA-binding transcriptional regulator AlpA